MPLSRESYGPGENIHKLRDFNKQFVEWYDPRRNMTRVRLLQGDCANLEDAFDMIEGLLRIYQSQHEVNRESAWHLHFPNMIVEPHVGDKIHNITTDEIYEVQFLGRDPYHQVWDHTCILSGTTSPLRTDRLVVIDKDRLISFTLGYPMHSTKRVTETDGALGHAESEPWRPTITARLRRKEPASIGSHPFGDRKVIKPMLMETFRDPEDRETFSLEIWRQPFDNMIQFDCWDVNPLGALRLSEWFEQFMRTHVGTLKRHGVAEILFWDQRDQEAREQWREGIVAQSVRYFFRTETLSVVRRSNLTTMSLHLRVVKHESGLHGGGPWPSGEELWFGRVHNSSGDYLYGTFDIEDHAYADPRTLTSNTGDPFDGVTGQFEIRP